MCIGEACDFSGVKSPSQSCTVGGWPGWDSSMGLTEAKHFIQILVHSWCTYSVTTIYVQGAFRKYFWENHCEWFWRWDRQREVWHTKGVGPKLTHGSSGAGMIFRVVPGKSFSHWVWILGEAFPG